MSEKKTGLGGSLLLARTETPKHPDVKASKRQRRREVADAKTKPASVRVKEAPERPEEIELPRDRCTIYLDQHVNERLELTARVEGKRRWQVVNAILRRYLPVYRVQKEDPPQLDSFAE